MPARLSDRLTRALDRLLRPHGREPAPGEAIPGERPPGRVVWFRCTDRVGARLLGGVLRHLAESARDVSPLVTVPDPDPGRIAGDALGASGVEPMPGPRETAAGLAAFLEHWRPDAAVLVGDAHLPATVLALGERRIPVLAAGVRLPPGRWLDRRLALPLARRHWGMFRHILTEDLASMLALRRAGAPLERLAVGGALAEDLLVPPVNVAERASLAGLLASRPVWCAMGLPLAEVAALAAAQGNAKLGLHRLLLVVVPADLGEGSAIRDAFADAGLETGLRSAGDDPVEDFPAYVADLPGESGLWLRLAPVTFMGGTLAPASRSLSPLVAAALGSAVVHGPETAAHRQAYARLDAAGGARSIATHGDLAAAVEDLVAPDRAAVMARAGWDVLSSADVAADRVVSLVLAALDTQAEVSTGAP